MNKETQRLLSILVPIVLLGSSAVAGTARVEMTVTDERGEPVTQGLFMFSKTGDPGRSFSISENEVGRYETSVEVEGDDATWQLVKVVVEGHLPVKLDLASRTNAGELIQDASGVDVGPGATMPAIRIPAGGSVKIELILGERHEVMARFAKARAATKAEALDRQPAAGRPGSEAYATALRLYNEGDVEGSLVQFAEAAGQAPDDAEIHATYAKVLYQAKRHEEFDRAAQAALELDPRNGELLMMLYSSRRSRGEMNAALDALLAVKELGTKDSRLLKHLDFVARTMGSSPDAIPAYNAILDLDHKNADACVALAFLYAEAGQTDQSRKHLDRAVGLAPERAAIIHLDLGSKLLGRKDAGDDNLARAIELIRTAVDLDPGLVVAHKKLGLALWKRKDYAGTKQAFQRYLELDPDAEDKEKIAGYLSELP